MVRSGSHVLHAVVLASTAVPYCTEAFFSPQQQRAWISADGPILMQKTNGSRATSDTHGPNVDVSNVDVSKIDVSEVPADVAPTDINIDEAAIRQAEQAAGQGSEDMIRHAQQAAGSVTAGTTGQAQQAEQCVTTKGDACVFPFIYKGITYNSCTTVDLGGTSWCATETDSSGKFISGKYGSCQDMCLATTTTTKAAAIAQASTTNTTAAPPTLVNDWNGLVPNQELPVPPGTMVNRRSSGHGSAEATCPKGSTLCQCTCHATEKSGCGTLFSGETCKATQTDGTAVEAIARCCNFPMAEDWELVTSTLSGASDQAVGVANVSCPDDKQITGCTCTPSISSVSCSGAQFVNDAKTCEAYYETGQSSNAAVKAVAKCAKFQDVDVFEIETDLAGDDATLAPTQTKCSTEGHTMIGCSCSNVLPLNSYPPVTKKCWGGSVIDGICECWGEGCLVTAVCASLPPVPINCDWTDWNDWGLCSKSCGAGTRSRMRSIQQAASNGGQECNEDPVEMEACEDNADVDEACRATDNSTVEEEEPDFEVDNSQSLIVLISMLAVAAIGGGGYFYYEQAQENKKRDAARAATAAEDDETQAEM